MLLQATILATLLALATAAPSARATFDWEWSVSGLAASCSRGDTGKPSVCKYQFTVKSPEVKKGENPEDPLPRELFEYQCIGESAQNDNTERYCQSVIKPGPKGLVVQGYIDLDKHQKTGNFWFQATFEDAAGAKTGIYLAELRTTYKYFSHGPTFNISPKKQKDYTPPPERRRDLEIV